MKTNETKVEKFLATNETVFAIPVYQRNYDWSSAQCKQLLKDIVEIGQNSDVNTHFIGSIVYVHDDVYAASGLTELTIIDGQQRLTTLTLIYVVLYKIAVAESNEKLSSRIQKTYLINEFAPDAEKLKLKPTENNQAALSYILSLDEAEEFKGYSKIVENFNYFRSEITSNNIEFVLKGLSKLIFVDIALDRQRDNPQRIFESLNSTGLELSQADLIRNYILMGLSRADQDIIYKNYWEVIEKSARDESVNKSRVSEFIRDYLTLKNKEIPNKSDVYNKFKVQYPTTTVNTLKTVLNELKSLVIYYNKLINPKNEKDSDIRKELEYIYKIEINVAFPFLMQVYEDYACDIIDKNTFLQILQLVQSFTFRRFVLGLPTNALNKIFMGLYDKVEHKKYLESVQRSLLQRSGVQRFPQDAETITAVKEKDFYNIKPKNRTYFFERLENYQNKEVVAIDTNSNITIEHIFPQNPDPKWKRNLGSEDYNFIKENYLNTIGNLTLSGNNGKLGNRSFLEKKEMNMDGREQGYLFSRLWLNRDLKNSDEWGRTQIEKRASAIAERFVKIWSLPNLPFDDEKTSNEISFFDTEDLLQRKLEYAVFFNKKLQVTQLNDLYIEVLKQLFDLEPETFFTSKLDEEFALSKQPKEDGFKEIIRLNEIYYVEGGIADLIKFDRIKRILTVFDIQDELLIKYAD